MLAKYYSRALPNASESLALSQVTQIRLTTQEEARDCRVQQLHPYDSALIIFQRSMWALSHIMFLIHITLSGQIR